ncbi:hypothetical protein [Cystobacter ferrugineus]|uniref:Uncharacterized protein n=1 Tax=Cystobacter ferrugineus TaxID=83449 RepID=A0A1L9B962_9BACT|nr:hypothetical protein [Cystobacter ferrugineus]OJH38782.1 hypothetical protein BON30_21385 [Cystobacter ferrugineus]
MKTLLAVLPLALSGQLPAQGSAQTAPTLPAESPRMTIIRFEDVAVRPPMLPAESPRRTVIGFEDDALGLLDPPTSRRGCLLGRSPLVRVRENFDDKVMQSADEM